MRQSGESPEERNWPHIIELRIDSVITTGTQILQN